MAIPCEYGLPAEFTVARVPIATEVLPLAVESLPTATLAVLVNLPTE